MNESTWSLTLLKLVAVFMLVGLNGLFVAAEFAFVKLRGTQLDPLIQRGNRRAKMARHLVNNLEVCISATQIGITLCGVATGALVQPVFRALLRPVFDLLQVNSSTVRTTTELIVGFFVSLFLLVVLGELVPKSVAIRKTLTTSLWTARPLNLFNHLTFPFIWGLNKSSQWFLARLGIAPASDAEQGHSEEELRILVAAADKAHASGGIGRSIILNAFEIRHRIAREVMRPRREIIALNTQASMDECLEIAERTRYSRFPLCERGDLDHTLGVVHIKDLYAMRQKARSGADLAPATRRIIFVPETARLERLLQLFQERQLHLALVVDEYGSTVGMVTLENIIEELVGQIQDEFDQEKPLIQPQGSHAWILDGILPLHELSGLVGLSLHAEDLTTTSGYVSRQLGGFPKPGDAIELGDYLLAVEETEGLRVTRLRLTKRATEPSRPPP